MPVVHPGTEAAQFIPLFDENDFARPVRVPDRTYGHGAELERADVDFFLSSVEAEKQQSYMKGYETGEKESLTAVSEKLDSQMAHWRQLLTSIRADTQQQMDEFFEIVEERVTRVAIAIAQQVIRGEMRLRPERVADHVRDAVAAYRAQGPLRVRVNAGDMVFLSRLLARGDGADEAGAGNSIDFVDDPGIAAGGFIVETDVSRYDHTLAAQLGLFERNLDQLYEATED